MNKKTLVRPNDIKDIFNDKLTSLMKSIEELDSNILLYRSDENLRNIFNNLFEINSALKTNLEIKAFEIIPIDLAQYWIGTTTLINKLFYLLNSKQFIGISLTPFENLVFKESVYICDTIRSIYDISVLGHSMLNDFWIPNRTDSCLSEQKLITKELKELVSEILNDFKFYKKGLSFKYQKRLFFNLLNVSLYKNLKEFLSSFDNKYLSLLVPSFYLFYCYIIIDFMTILQTMETLSELNEFIDNIFEDNFSNNIMR